MMHQHPRPPPATASPASSEQTNPTRTNNPRDRDVQTLRTTSPLTQGSGSSEDFVNARQDQPTQDPATSMQRLNQVIQNFHTKATLIILHSRIDLAPAYSSKTNEKRVNKWFNIELDETDDYLDDIKRWKRCDVKDDKPPPLVIETFLTTDALPQDQRLVILDEDQKRWDARNALDSRSSEKHGKRNDAESNEILLERWTIELGKAPESFPSDLATTLPLVYKKSIVLFRSLYTYCNFLPAWKLSRRVGKGRSTMAMKVGFRIVDGNKLHKLSRPDNLEVPLCGSNYDVANDYSFGSTESPAGPFSIRVRYRENCDFRIDDSEELLSSRFLGADDDLFRPSLSGEKRNDNQREGQNIGSLPNDARRHLMERPELGHAYGSLSTFHHAGISPGTSPISALRAAKELGSDSPSPEQTRPLQQPIQQTTQRPQSALRATTGPRKSSFNFQPFKTPALSASPLGASPLASSPRPSRVIPALGSLTEESSLHPPIAQTIVARNPVSLASEPVIASSTSSSPKPAPAARFSSSFSHRRGRLSTDRVAAKADEDQISSGRASATSSTQPGSGLMTEPPAGGSSGSMHEDEDNISDFLKMLDLKKDLLSPASDAAADASARRTAAALNKFHRMRDSNAALSDSMSSSLMIPRSSASSSRQLSGVPQMAAAGSTSTSPGKPISPHTPHTPFAPSRLSATFIHDDVTDQPINKSLRERQPSNPTPNDPIAQARSSTQIPAIPIPNSPRFGPVYRRSSSAQRRPLSSEDDIGDLYGMKSASMGTHEKRNVRHQPTRLSSGGENVSDDTGTSDTQPLATRSEAAGAAGDDNTSAIGPASARNAQQLLSAARSGTSSLERAESSSAGGSWNRSVRMRRESRPQFEDDEDDSLPFAMFAMETSHITANNSGEKKQDGMSER